MKLSIQFLSLAIALSGSLVSAGSHKHRAFDHRHHHHRRADVQSLTHTVTVVQNVYTNDGGHTPAASPEPTPKHDSPAADYPLPSPQSTPCETETDHEQPTKQPHPDAEPSQVPVSQPESYGQPTGDPECEFPDGEIDCSTFPDAYGVIGVPWMNLGGWSGIQLLSKSDTSPDCVDNTLCSYACPPGYSKAQWPADQPANGESHGGLACRGGKLYKTNSAYNSLCVQGKGNVYVRNKLQQAVPICRTDYPGTENMDVPTYSTPGSTLPLTNPDGGSYYQWQGKTTSAQYYVNPQGTPLEDGCRWGAPNGGLGNWSPMIFGVGYTDGKSWLSISQNSLYSGPQNFNVKVSHPSYCIVLKLVLTFLSDRGRSRCPAQWRLQV